MCNAADLDLLDMYGVSAVHLAAENGHILSLRALLDAGAACNVGTAKKQPQWVTTTGTFVYLFILFIT